jgi:23S rRNA (adenine2503-C2)-methyltransferase|tara:strand:- start:280 stop:537 length:258 start_codon:yes stop_codon:yes gene_type:complete
MKYSIHDEAKVKEMLKENGFPTFRYAQIENAVYKNFVTDFQEIQTIPKKMRDLLDENFTFNTFEIDTQKTSENGQTTKMLFKTSK